MERIVEGCFEVIGLDFAGEGDAREGVGEDCGGEAFCAGCGGLKEEEGIGTGYLEAQMGDSGASAVR